MNNLNSNKQFQIVQKMKRIILVLIFFVMCSDYLLHAQANDTVMNHESKFIKQISSIAETLDVFPIDFIANQGTLTVKSEGQLNTIRVELTLERFIQFYYFCDMALHASHNDVSDCIDYLDKSTAREKALILTILYVLCGVPSSAGVVALSF